MVYNIENLINEIEKLSRHVNNALVKLNSYTRFGFSVIISLSKYFGSRAVQRNLEQNRLKAKEYWYLAGELSRMWHDKTKFSNSNNQVLYGILFSDNEDLFQEFLKWEVEMHGEELHDGGAWGFIVFFRFLLNGQREMAREELVYWKKMAEDEGDFGDDTMFWYWEYFIAEKMLFNEFKDIPDMVTILLHRQYDLKEANSKIPKEKYFSLWGTYIAKIVWLLGHQLNFNSPFIDMDMVKISPLDNYPSLEEKLIELGLDRNIGLKDLKSRRI